MSDEVVIQWSRLGDLLQSRVLLRNLKQCSQENEQIILCCDSRYKEIAALFPEVDQIWPIELQKITASARHQGTHKSLVNELNLVVNDYINSSVDTAYILSESKAAVVFAELLNPLKITGYFYKDNQLAKSKCLEEYFEVVKRQEDCKSTIADIWGKLAPKQTISWLDPLKVELLTEDAKQNSLLKIAIFTDAGEDYRKIPAKWIELLVKKLIESSRYDITLLGNNVESLTFNSNIVKDCRGQLSLSQLSKLLNKQNIVIGSDSGGLHLAAALGCSTIGLYFGGANCVYTGVYSSQSLILQDPKWDEATANNVVKLISNRTTPISATFDYPNMFMPNLEQNGLSYRSNARKQGISIIIPERGSTHYTVELLKELESELSNIEHEIIIISSVTSYEHTYFDSTKLKQYFQESSLSFSEACNWGETLAKYSWFLFLNNDTKIIKGQLVNLFNGLDEKTVYSPLILYPDGLIQNQGVELTAQGICEIAHARKEIDFKTDSPDSLSAIALLIHRNLFNELNGFDKAYRNGYEDLDLCQRVKLSGANLKVNLSSSIMHYRSSSSERFSNDSKNLELFLSRWNSKFKKQIVESKQKENFTPLLFLSDEPKTSAGALLRWIWPFGELGFKEGKEFSWIECGYDLNDNHLTERIDFAETIIVFRPLKAESILNYLLNAVRQSEKTLITDCDDLILDRFQKNSIRHLGRKNYEYAYLKLLENSTLITAASVGIKGSLAENGFTSDYLPTNPNIKQLNEKCVQKGNTFNIGFMGTQAHMVDLGIVLPAIEKILDRNSKVRFYWWRCRPGELAYHPQVRQGGPFVSDYETHLHRLHNFSLDMMVVPLSDSKTNQARTPIKFYEYALAGIPTIFSNTAPYSQIVKQNETGILCSDNTTKWIDAIENLLNYPLLREQIATNARKFVTDSIDNVPRNSLLKILQIQNGVTHKHFNENAHIQAVALS